MAPALDRRVELGRVLVGVGLGIVHVRVEERREVAAQQLGEVGREAGLALRHAFACKHTVRVRVRVRVRLSLR